MKMRPFFARTILAFSTLAWTCVAPAAIYVQPYLQNPRPDGMTIVWWTDETQLASQVEFGLGNYNTIVAASNERVQVTTPVTFDKYVHVANITGLQAETTYTYRVHSGSFVSNAYTFKTSILPNSSFHVAILGDGRTDTATIRRDHGKVVKQAETENASLIFEAGDMVNVGSATDWDYFYRSVITATSGTEPGVDTGSKIPFLTAVGNHEIYNGSYTGGGLTNSMILYRKFMENPDNGATNANWRERYYVVKYGCATFIVLDTNNTSSDAYDNHDLLADGTTPDWEPGSEQYNWMVNQLAEAQSHGAFTFVLMHPAPYTRGVHGSPTNDQRGYQLRCLDPLFRQYGVDAVFSSHDHLVEHCLTGPTGFQATMNVGDPSNLNWLVQGNSGEGARAAQTGWEQWMDILDNNAAPFYTYWYYTWVGTAYRSFLDIGIANAGNGSWQATVRTVRIDPSLAIPVSIYEDTFTLTRTGKYSIAGHVNLQDLPAGLWPQIPVTVELRKHGGATTVQNISLDSSGNYMLIGVDPGTYDLAFKANHWLRKVLTDVQVADLDLTDRNVDLTNGDCDGNNEVTSTDLSIILAAMDSVSNGPNWNPAADLDGDQNITGADLFIILSNLDELGGI